MVTSKQLRLAILAMAEERTATLENNVATTRLRLAMETNEERKARLVKMVATERLRLAMEKMVATEQLRLAMEMDKEKKQDLRR